VRPAIEVADIFRHHGEAFRAAQGDRLTRAQRRVMAAIEACRTAVLGGHVEHCEQCRELRVAYNSCRNRHCPKCQGLARLQWLADRRAELLPVPYFHLVFTLPAPVAAIALSNKAVVYDILFKAAAETIRIIGADPKHLGAETGMIAILHTWGQTLTHHPHLHCIVPGGGLGPDGGFVPCRRPGFFLPVRVLSRVYRGVFLDRLQTAFEAGSLTLCGELARLREPSAFGAQIKALRSVPWVVYAKRPFAGPGPVLDYLGRYTHRVAIANSRLLACQNGRVRFRWKDYRCHHKSKAMTLEAGEFIRRFLLHVLPAGFRRIRHVGFLANACRTAKLARLRTALDAPAPPPPVRPKDYRERCALLTGRRIDQCPRCGGRMVDLGRPLPRCRRPSDPIPPCDTS
jgi:Putative transposase/Transposase zinc-binding domain